MSPAELRKMGKDLPRGAKWTLAVLLECDPSKITRAFNGMVKDQDFMDSLQAKSREILAQEEIIPG